MPYKNRDKQRRYQRERVAKIRKRWLDENGPCTKCGSWDELNTHHKDPLTKVSHSVWSWSEERRNKELTKCEVLCAACHIAWHEPPIPHGTRSGYDRGCKCRACRDAQKIYMKKYRAGKILERFGHGDG